MDGTRETALEEAARIEQTLYVEAELLERTASQAPEVLAGELRAMAARRRKLLDEVTGAIREVRVALPEDASRYQVEEAPEQPVAPEKREG